MRVASFVLPITHSRGERHDTSHQEARGRLLTTFGGYTASNVRGAWKSPGGATCYDNSVRYEVATDWTPDRRATFADIALDCGRLARQQCIYVQWDDGDVEFLNCEPVTDSLIQREPTAGDA